MTRVFTTGQVARIFSVNINTVIKWFDDGKLEGFRLPRSNERRIYRESVVDFMESHDIAPELLQAFDDEQGNKGKRGRAKSQVNPVRQEDLRTFARKPVELPGVVLDNGTVVPVKVRNLSMGGVYVTGFASADHRIPEEFSIKVDDAEQGWSIESTCQLVHLKRTRDEGFGLGCRFTQVDPSALQGYLQRI
ncbi:MAG: PilZ domain-containing protein [Myxococcales bacterium]|nr:PilZ domain-containing protein [Myxococcales bacterium]